MTSKAIESESTSKVLPLKEKMSKAYSPSDDWIKSEAPKPIKKLNSWPENTPATAVPALPLLANVVIEI